MTKRDARVRGIEFLQLQKGRRLVAPTPARTRARPGPANQDRSMCTDLEGFNRGVPLDLGRGRTQASPPLMVPGGALAGLGHCLRSSSTQRTAERGSEEIPRLVQGD